MEVAYIYIMLLEGRIHGIYIYIYIDIDCTFSAISHAGQEQMVKIVEGPQHRWPPGGSAWRRGVLRKGGPIRVWPADAASLPITCVSWCNTDHIT